MEEVHEKFCKTHHRKDNMLLPAGHGVDDRRRLFIPEGCRILA